MAKQKITKFIFTDDLTGQEVGEDQIVTQRFTFEGVQYEIDLTSDNTEKFRTAMKPWMEASRRVGGKAAKKTAAKKAASSASNGSAQHSAAEIRDWARTQGLDVPDRGRIPDEVREHFELAQQAS